MRSFFFEIFLMLAWVVAFLIVYIIAKDIAEKRRQNVAEVKESLYGNNIEAYYLKLNEIGRKREKTIIIGFIVVAICGIALFVWLAGYGFKFHWLI